MSLKPFLFFLSFSIILSGSVLSQEDYGEIIEYLDSASKYLKKKRPDLVVQFNMKADVLTNNFKEVPFEYRYQIQSNYIWAFNEVNRLDLRKQHLKKAIAIIESERLQGRSNFVRYHLANATLASAYSESGEFDSSKMYYEIAIKLAREEKDLLFFASALNNKGLFLVKYENWDAAKVYFDQALEVIRMRGSFKDELDSVLYCSIRDNVADYYFHKNDTLKGVRIIESNLRYLKVGRRSIEKLMRWGQKLLAFYIKKQDVEKAGSLMIRLKSFLPLVQGESQYKNKNQLLIFEIQLAKITNNEKLLNSLTDSRLAFLEEYLHFLKEINTSVSNRIFEYESYSTDKELKAAEEAVSIAKRREQLNTILLAIYILVSILIIFLIITNYRRRIKLGSRDRKLKVRELEIAELEKEKIGFQLENKSKDLSNLLMQSSLQGDWSKYLIEELKKIHKSDGDKAKQEITELILELRQKSSIYTNIGELQKGMEEANTQFFKQLDSKFPSLTKAERETCGLIRMNLQAKEIALIRNISPSSVRKLRQRIRAKIELGSKEDLYHFIKNI